MDDHQGDYTPPEADKFALDLSDAPPSGGGDPIPITFEYIFYHPPRGNSVALDFFGAYAPPPGNSIPLEFAPDEGGGPVREDQHLFPPGHDGHDLGHAKVRHQYRRLVATGIGSTLAYGTPAVESNRAYIEPGGIYASRYGSAAFELWVRHYQLSGFVATLYGRPKVKNTSWQMWPAGIDSLRTGRPKVAGRNAYLQATGIDVSIYGTPEIFNQIPQIYPDGIAAPEPEDESFHEVINHLTVVDPKGGVHTSYGEPFLWGGSRFVGARGFYRTRYGRPSVVNTSSDSLASPRGIAPPYPGRPSVSPRMLYADGIKVDRYGSPKVQFPPFPVGWQSSRFGRPAVDWWDKHVEPAGIAVGEWVGYPRVQDRAREIQVPSALDEGVFGDTHLESTTVEVRALGHDSFESSRYTIIYSNRRFMQGRGYDMASLGHPGIYNFTASLDPPGVAPVPPGWVNISHYVRTIQARGFHHQGYGTPLLRRTPWAAAHGFMSQRMGHPRFWLSERGAPMVGFDAQRHGDTTIWFRVRHANPDGFFYGKFGTPEMQRFVRGIAATGVFRDGYGRPRVTNLDRGIDVPSIAEEAVGKHMVGGSREVQPFGYIATRFGERIIPESMTLYPLGFAGEYGWPTVSNRTTVLHPEGFTLGDTPRQRWGFGKVHNLRQYIEMYYFHESELNPPGWSLWTLIENRDKAIGAVGQAMQRMGTGAIYHNARVLEAASVPAPTLPEYHESGMVAFRVRPLELDGLEPPYISGWSRIFNDADVIAPGGLVASLFGEAELENTRRYYDRVGGFLSERQGHPMIAFRIREIDIEPRYSIAAPRIQLHVVDLHTRYIDDPGTDMLGMGLPSLSIHFNKIHTRWTHRDEFGWSTLRNLTPEMITRGRASDVYGDAMVRLEWRPVDADGSDMQLFGRTVIADRDRTMTVRGFRAGAIGHRLRVILGSQPPNTPQTLQVISRKDKGAIVGKPHLNQYVLYAHGRDMTSFGTAFCQSNAIIMDHGIKDDDYGRPFVGLKNRTISVTGYIENPITPGRPRLSPYTIWCRPATRQANRNHPGGSWREIGWPYKNQPWRRLGRPRVSTYRNDLHPRSIGNSLLTGRPRLSLKLRYVEVTGIRSLRMGWHEAGDGTQFVTQMGARSFMALGKPKLTRPPYTGPQGVGPSGFVATRSGDNSIELFNRTMIAKGSDMARLGGRRRGDRPYMYQGLAVHFPMPTIPGGTYMADYGEAWVSMRVREIVPQGFNAFVSEYELGRFKDRLTVRNAYTPSPETQLVEPVGIDRAAIGTPNVMLAARHILPDGNADQYRKGAPDA